MRRTASSLTGAVIAGVATVVVSGLTTVMPAAATTPSSDGHTAVDRLAWGPCPGDMDAPKLECSTLRVPLDYRQPDGTQIDIAVSRLPSADPSKRRGVLLTNPGGPGGPGLEYPAQLAAGLPPQVLESYDVIGFDPRGVGESTPVTCELTEAQLTRGAFPAYAESRADVPKAARYARKIAEQCASSPTAGLHQHITTANTARDMDRIREALGESDVSYLGASYGTYLGAVYTTTFPQRSDRIVLDSNLGPGGYDVTAMRGFARGLQDRFPDFAEFAAARPEYGLGTTEAAVTAKFYELVDRLDEKPVHGIDGLALRGMTFTYTYADAQFSHLAEVWQAVDTGSPLPEFPAPPSSDMENLQAARLVVTCGDSRWPDKVRDYQRAVAVDRTLYPMLGGSTANIGPCAFWPDERPEAPVQIGDRGPSNVLMVQNERDPGTPLAGALKLRSAFGNRATMVTADQGGHGVYPFSANTCAVDAVTEFLTTGQRPAHDLACAAETREQSR